MLALGLTSDHILQAEHTATANGHAPSQRSSRAGQELPSAPEDSHASTPEAVQSTSRPAEPAEQHSSPQLQHSEPEQPQRGSVLRSLISDVSQASSEAMLDATATLGTPHPPEQLGSSLSEAEHTQQAQQPVKQDTTSPPPEQV